MLKNLLQTQTNIHDICERGFSPMTLRKKGSPPKFSAAVRPDLRKPKKPEIKIPLFGE